MIDAMQQWSTKGFHTDFVISHLSIAMKMCGVLNQVIFHVFWVGLL